VIYTDRKIASVFRAKIQTLEYDSTVSATPLLPSAEPQILPPQASTSDLHLYDTELRKAAKSYKRSLAAIAYYGHRLQLADQWGVFQCEDEEAYRESLDIPRSTWYKHIKIGRVLHNLSIPELEQIPTGNLELLSELEPEQIIAFVADAKRLTYHQLAGVITEFNQQCGKPYEPQTYVRYKVPVSSKNFLEEAVVEFQAKHNLASPGRALELMVADIHDRLNVMGVLLQIRNDLAAAQELLGEREPAVYSLLEQARSRAGEAYTQALSEARKGSGHKSNGNGHGHAAHA
jgi:hypothetical protein